MRLRFLLPAGICALVFSGGAAGSGSTMAAPTPQEAGQEQEQRSLPVSRGKRLILKDGTFQLVRSWEIKADPSGGGRDRVRYYSVERSFWEEIPAELVDFAATRKAEQEQAEREATMREQIEVSRVAQLAGEIDVDSSIEIAPGLFLPEEAGLFVLAPKPGPEGSGQMLLPLSQVAADAKVDKGRLLTQILVPIPIVPGKQRIEVAGAKAVLRISNPSPEFYVRTDDDREPEMELIRVKVKGNKREVEVVKTYITGQQREEREAVSVQRWRVARGVYRLTMSQSLEPGEYVLAEILPGEGINLYVWDFGVDGAAAAKSNR